MDLNSKIYVAGHRGLVGSALCRRLAAAGYRNLVTRTHSELDLLRQEAVEDFFRQERPEHVILAAARVGGIRANATYPAQFIYENLQIQNNVIHSAHLVGVKKLLFLGSSCIYPKHPKIPITEDQLLVSPLEPTNEAYALAKIAGLKMCSFYRKQYGDDFISIMPTNLYGLGDNYHPENSHVIPALIRRFHDAKMAGSPEVVAWGTGRVRREFLYSDDLADACLLLLQKYSSEETINCGCGEDMTIQEVTEQVARTVGYAGRIAWDTTRPDGTPCKLLDSSRILALGWRPRVSLREGLQKAYEDFLRLEV